MLTKTFDRMMTCFAGGTIMTTITLIFGEVDKSLIILLAFMFLDMITGILAAIKNKELSSQKCFNGIAKKFFIVVYVILGHLADVLLNVNYFRTAVCFMYIVNDGLSIIENGCKFGVKVPEPIKKALEIINSKEESNEY